MKRTTPVQARSSHSGHYTPAAPVPPVGRPAVRGQARRKSLAPSRPVLWFLFLFNLAVAVAAVAAGNHLHVHGHVIHGAQVAAGMGVVAAGAGAGLLRRRGQRA